MEMKKNDPIFLKESSDLESYVEKLKNLYEKASGQAKEKIEKELKMATIGLIGEKNVAFELRNSGIPMYILHDVYYEIDELSAQIDYIVVTNKIIFVIECKNLIGNIEVDSYDNFIRSYEYGGKRIREGIYSPITQNQRHLEVLKRIRKQQKKNILTQYMFEKNFANNYRSVVVLANPKTILNAKSAKKETKQQIIRADQLITYIKEVNRREKDCHNNDKEMRKLAENLLSAHIPNSQCYLKKYESLAAEVEKEILNLEGGGKKQIGKERKDTDEVKYLNKNSLDQLVKDLKAFRLKRAKEEQVKPYFIFNDAQMMTLIEKKPSNRADLLQISGFGSVKVEKYGDEILKILNM